MSKGGWVLGLVWLASCGQELALPVSGLEEVKGSAGRSGGITGSAGDDGEAAQAGRLAVANEPPVFAGGAAGDADAGEPGVVSSSGSAGRGGAGSGGPAGGVGHAGTATVGGAPSAEGDGGRANEGGATGTLPALFFSEYVEGSGSAKALEIFAVQAASLEGCDLETYFNGKLEPSRLALHGDLAAGQAYVLCSSALASAQPQACDRSTSLTFNGDDALLLRCGGVALDVFGQIGVDPGVAWGQGLTTDHTLRRRCEVTAGRSDGSAPFEPSSEWLSFGPDVFADLGQRGCAMK